MLTAFHSVIRSVVDSSKLTIASVRRHCLGGGAELALMCDIVYASPDSVWGFPEIKLACYPPVASVALSAIVGQKLAAELMLTGVRCRAKKLWRRVGERRRRRPGNAGGGMYAAGFAVEFGGDCDRKEGFYSWDAIHFDKGLARAEQIYFDELMKTADAQEGIAAFMERRRPKWVGK